MSDLLKRIKLSKYPSSVWLGKANGQEIIDLIEQQQKRIVELERKLQLEEELHHVAESGCTELFATIEQQQEQIAKLEKQLANAKALQSHSNHIVALKARIAILEAKLNKSV